MASMGAAVLKPGALEIERAKSASIPRPSYNIAIGYLRGFLVVLVLAHHSVLAYVDAPKAFPSMLTYPRWWRAFPVQDHVHSTGFALFTGFNDDFFMSLMFFISGLFVWSSLRRKGRAEYMRDRLRRLGIPFLFVGLIVMPIAYYPAYLMTGEHGVIGYARVWSQFGDWPTGPAWFIWLLLTFDLGAGGLFALKPNFGDAIGRLVSNAKDHPAQYFLLLVSASAAVYIPMVVIYGPMYWTSVGPFQVQTARLFHYALYFTFGIGIGAYGIERGLLTADGTLASHWLGWTIWMVSAFASSVVFFLIAISKANSMSAAASKHDRRCSIRRDLRRDFVLLYCALPPICEPSRLGFRQPERQRIWDVPDPFRLRVVASVRTSGCVATRPGEGNVSFRGHAAAQLGNERRLAQPQRRRTRCLRTKAS